MFGAGGRVSAGSGHRFSLPPAAAVLENHSGAQNFNSSSGDNFTITKPAGTVEGDLMIAQITTDGGGMIAPTGWTLIQSQENGVAQKTHWKIAGASEPASYTWTITPGGASAGGGIVRITGHDATTPIDISSVATGSTASITCPAVTASTEYSLRLRFANNFNATNIGGNLWNGVPTEGNMGFGAQKDTATSSSVGTFSFTGTSNNWVAITIVVKPAVGA